MYQVPIHSQQPIIIAGNNLALGGVIGRPLLIVSFTAMASHENALRMTGLLRRESTGGH